MSQTEARKVPECPMHGYTVKQVREAYYYPEKELPGVFALQCRLYNFEPHLFVNKNYGALVVPHAFGQYRIKLLDMRKMSHDNIVREMCTYQDLTMFLAISALVAAEDPEQWCRSIARPWNCEEPGKGRIRLDNKPGDLNTLPDGSIRPDDLKLYRVTNEQFIEAWKLTSGPYEVPDEPNKLGGC